MNTTDDITPSGKHHICVLLLLLVLTNTAHGTSTIV